MTEPITKRTFLKAAARIGGLLAARGALNANPLGLPLGLQPYTVRNELKADFRGTLKKVAAMGYQELEVSGPGYDNFYGYQPAELRQILNGFGLRTPSCHYGAPKDEEEWKRHMDGAHQLGLQYMLCGTPPSRAESLDGWKRTAELFNKLGKHCREAGFTFGYHNHNFEFRVYDGVTGYDQLLRSSDPDLVKMEIDCFWMTFAGHDPVDYLKRQPRRFVMLHIKDLKPGYPPTTGRFKGIPFTEVGSGIIDWKRIFQAARHTSVDHYFVEQDLWDRSPLECARMSADYLKKLKV